MVMVPAVALVKLNETAATLELAVAVQPVVQLVSGLLICGPLPI